MALALVTGLCLSRNLGGPAMALTLVEELKKRISDIDFVFAVTPFSFEQEERWAKHYGLKIVRGDIFLSYLSATNPVLKTAKLSYRLLKRRPLFDNTYAAIARSVHEEFMASYEKCDLVIDMQGISYVGDGARGPFEGINSYSNQYYANKYKKPFAFFIQSFGPFNDWKVRFFARKAFEQVDFVPARGKNSARYCREITKDPTKVYDFPDVAILLPTNVSWAELFLRQHNLSPKGYVIVSPSSVIFKAVSTSVGGSVGEKHIDSMIKVCKLLIKRSEFIVFLPHMYSNNSNECDRHVAKLIASHLPKSSYVIVEEDIDPMMAKGLISLAKYAIVSRYHALVAALSTGVDVITIGWNIKYQDMMEYYGKEKFAIDVRSHTPATLAAKVQELLDDPTFHDINARHESFEHFHSYATERVNLAFQLLSQWIQKVLSDANA
ncbi:MAG: polysaccharide pyruvyl transferase family protein [Candidatus Caldarchaeum sp.]